MEIQSKIRIAWADWMMLMIMYLLILSRFFPIGGDVAALFCVPVLFILFGYQQKENGESNDDFADHFVYKIIKPAFFLWIIYVIFTSVYRYGDLGKEEKVLEIAMFFLFNIFGGWVDYQIGSPWIIYSFCIIKLLRHVCGFRVSAMLSFAMMLVAMNISAEHYFKYNAILNTFVCYPLFILGESFRRYGAGVVVKSVDRKEGSILCVALLFAVVVLHHFNGTPCLERGYYGISLILFLIGSIASAVILYIVGKLLQKKTNSFVATISDGWLQIIFFNEIITLLLQNYCGDYHGIFCYVFSLIILILFYPILIIVKKYVPLLSQKP